MLAPPTIFARHAARVARRAVPSRSSSSGTAVSGNFAGFDRSRDIDSLGSSTCASPPTRATGVVQHDGDARAEADRRDRAARPPPRSRRRLTRISHGLAAHSRRKIRSRASTGANRDRYRSEHRLDFAEHEKSVRRERVDRTSRTIAPAFRDRSRSARCGRRSGRAVPRRRAGSAGRAIRSARCCESPATRVNGGVAREVPLTQLRRRVGEIGFLELSARGGVETLAVDVRPEHVDASDLRRACRSPPRIDGTAWRANTARRRTNIRRSRRESSASADARAPARRCAAIDA